MKTRWKAALAGAALLAGLIGFCVWSLQGGGLSFWLTRAGVQVQGLRGGLWGELEIDHLRWQGGPRLELRHLRWQRLRLGWADGRPQLQGTLKAAALDWTSAPGPAKPLRAQDVLQRLRLPLDLELQTLQIEHLHIDGKSLEGLRLQLQAGRDPLWRLNLRPLTLAGGETQGQIELKADGQLIGNARWQHPGLAALELQAQGNLAQLQLALGLGPELQAQARLQPLAPQPLQSLAFKAQDLDLRRLHPQAPQTRLTGRLDATLDAQGQATIQLDLRNAAARRLDQNGWPLRAAQAALTLKLQDWRALRLQALDVDLGDAQRSAGHLTLQQAMGLPDPSGAWAARLGLQAVQLRELDAHWPNARLGGALQLQQAGNDKPLELALQGQLQTPERWQLDATARLQGRQPEGLTLQVQGPSGQRLQAEAELRGRALQLQAATQGDWWLPGPWRAQRQTLNLKLQAALDVARLDAAALRQARGTAELQLLAGTRLAGLPATAQARWQRRGALPAEAELQLQTGAQSLALRAHQPGADWQPLSANAQLPELAALKPWWQPWLQEAAGSLNLQLDAQSLQLQAQNLSLRLPQQARWTLAALKADGRLKDEQIEATLEARELKGSALQLPRFQAQIQGPLAAQQWRWQAEWKAAERLWNWHGQALAQGRWGAAQWRQIATRFGPLDAPTPWLELRDAQLDWQGERFSLAATPLQLAGQTLQVHTAHGSPADWALQLSGQPQLASWLQAASGIEWRGDLVADLSLQAQGRAGERAQGELRLQRRSGDLSLSDESGRPRALDIEALSLLLRRQEQAATAELRLDSRAHGQLLLNLHQTDSGALSGALKAQLPTLQALDPWLPDGVRLTGQAQAELSLAGTREQPQLRGSLQAQAFGLQHPASGFASQDGALHVHFEGQRATLQQGRFGGIGEQGGQLLASGSADWSGELRADLQLQADAFRVLQRYDRQLVLSGQTALRLRPKVLELTGALTADQGRFDLGRADAPRLGEDVQVLRSGNGLGSAKAVKTSSRWQPKVDLRLDLGQRLTVRGRGLQTRTTGALRVQQEPGKAARWSGQIESNGGRYRAYGQDLEIDTGVLSFDSGVLDDPRLDLLAVRPDLEQRVGVRVDGRAQNPRVRLYSDPQLPDTDTLSWLLLGRAPDELGRSDAALLQRAVLAVLAGEGESPTAELLGKLGLTELSLSPTDEGERVLRLGAQLSRRWSVAYERSLGQAAGHWQLAYRIGQRFTLRAQTGEDSGLDLLWLWKFD